MEWVETTGKTLEEAREAALDQLGVGADEAEFDVVEEPKAGLFGRTRGQARLRARIKPTPARPKQERKRRSKSDKSGSDKPKAKASQAKPDSGANQEASAEETTGSADGDAAEPRQRSSRGRGGQRGGGRNGTNNNSQEKKMSNEERPQSDVTPQEVGDAAVSFMNDLVTAFGADGESELTVDGTELDVQVRGDDLGLLVGPGGRTLNAVQDLVRVAAQRRLGDHETRLRIDVAGYRERRSIALGKFAADVAAQVRDSGAARSLEPMTSADRKVIHDALNDEDGVASTSSGEDPYRRVIVEPA
ncbi:MAG: RNA-binding cell elongation regulator Jag/EloR [Ilumatobacter sp.]|nr:RNA-binding cell elongation regulator Jag/EloR [Ilumatobacter sp.]